VYSSILLLVIVYYAFVLNMFKLHYRYTDYVRCWHCRHIRYTLKML